MRKVINKLVRIKAFLNDRCFYWTLYLKENNKILGNVFYKILLRGRKLVAFYGECHVYLYNAYFAACKEFKQQYKILGGKEIEYLARYHKRQINRSASWRYVDVLVYNSGVPKREDAPALEFVLEWLPEKCQRIEVTNAAFKGYTPQHTEKKFDNNGYFTWGDKNLNKLLELDDEVDTSLNELKSKAYYNAEYVNSFFDKSITRMKQYERGCTVKIADYVEKHGKTRLLYYSVTHPENEVMEEIAKRILLLLGIESDKLSLAGKSNCSFDLHSHGEVVYPSVWYGLGIEGEPENRKIQPGNYKEIQLTFADYIKEYVEMGKAKRGKESL